MPFASVNRFSASSSSLVNLSIKQYLKCESFSASLCAFVPNSSSLIKYLNKSIMWLSEAVTAASCLICFAVGLLS